MRTILAFGLGIACGAVATWMYMAEKYKHLMDGSQTVESEEFEEDGSDEKEKGDMIVRKYQGSADKKEDKKEEKGAGESASPSSIIRKVTQKVDYNKVASVAADVVKQVVDDPSEMECPQQSNKERDEEKPYKISPDEFANEKQFFDKISLVYFIGDEVLAYHPDEKRFDDDPETIDDIDQTVGKENLKYFGEYEAGMLYVRNEALGADYSIEIKYAKYSDGIHMA